MGVGGQRHAPVVLPPRKTRYPFYRRLCVHQGWSGQVRDSIPGPSSPYRVSIPTALSRPTYSVQGLQGKKSLMPHNHSLSVCNNILSLRVYFACHTLDFLLSSSTSCTKQVIWLSFQLKRAAFSISPVCPDRLSPITMTQGQDFNCPSKITAYVSAWRGTSVESSTRPARTQVGRKPTSHWTEDHLQHDGKQKVYYLSEVIPLCYLNIHFITICFR